jgi:heterotetrameric sarcosine oxidase gamma subunit
LWQYHAWPEGFAEMARLLSDRFGLVEIPKASRAAATGSGALLRIHPQRLWFVASGEGVHETALTANTLPPQIGVALDLSHARTLIHVADAIAQPLLTRFVTVDLRPQHFPPDAVALTSLHRVGVVLWRRSDGIDILAPTSFAVSIWDALSETAERL